MSNTLSLDTIVNVTVLISPLSAPRGTFNETLIVGEAEVIPTSERLRLYTDPDDMLTDGFLVTDPEYIAAEIYFSQQPAPIKLWIGRQDTTETSPPETALEAVQACRLASFEWYMAICLAAVADDHKDIALWAESAAPSTLYLFTTNDADILTVDPSPDDIFLYLKTLNYGRVMGQYATTIGGEYPNNIYAIVAIAGYVCGQNTGLANSAFTLKFKQEVGIAPEPLTTTLVNIIANKNGNLYLSYGNYYTFFEQGKMANGQFFDEVINLDMLVNNMQLSVMDLLYGNPKIPQTDDGVTQIMRVINLACEQAVTLGFLAPGKWTGPNVLNLKTDDMLPRGYMVQAQSVDDQSQADRELRKSPPIYVAIKEAGAIHSVLIGVYVNR